MSTPGKAESGQHQQVYQNRSVNFPSVLPVKKRRFPIIHHPGSDNLESQIPDEEKSRNNQESLFDSKNTCSHVNDARKTSAASSNIELGQANKVPQTSIEKQEISCGSELSMGLMNVELSLGLDEPLVFPALERKRSVDICFTSEESDSSQLSLSVSEEKPVGFKNSNCTLVDDEKKVNILVEVNEESFESDCGSQENRSVDNSMGIGENILVKADEDLEEGEVWEPGFETSRGSGDQDFDGKYSIKENHDKSNTNKDSVSISCKANSEINNNNPLQKVLDTVLEEVEVDENIFVSVTTDKSLDISVGEDIEEVPVKEALSDRPTNVDRGRSGFEVEIAATTDDNQVVQEASLSGNDAANDSGNKSRIINLSRPSVVTSPCRTISIPNKLIIQQSGKKRYSALDEEMQPQGNREENYGGDGGYRANNQFLKNSRPNFMQRKWESDHDFASETSFSTPNYRSFIKRLSSGDNNQDQSLWRRSPDLPQHNSPGFYRRGRMRSSDHGCFRNELFSRRRGSPYVPRHPNNYGRGHSHHRLLGNSRRRDMLDSIEMEDGDEYMNNEPFQSNNFHDERRMFAERRGAGIGHSFRFHMNDDELRPYRFCPETDSEFVVRCDNMREGEFDEGITRRRNRNNEDQQDVEYRCVERCWHDGDRGKRRRF